MELSLVKKVSGWGRALEHYPRGRSELRGAELHHCGLIQNRRVWTPNANTSLLQMIILFQIIKVPHAHCRKVLKHKKEKKILERKRIPQIILYRDNCSENTMAPFLAFGSQSFLSHGYQV